MEQKAHHPILSNEMHEKWNILIKSYNTKSDCGSQVLIYFCNTLLHFKSILNWFWETSNLQKQKSACIVLGNSPSAVTYKG